MKCRYAVNRSYGGRPLTLCGSTDWSGLVEAAPGAQVPDPQCHEHMGYTRSIQAGTGFRAPTAEEVDLILAREVLES